MRLLEHEKSESYTGGTMHRMHYPHRGRRLVRCAEQHRQLHLVQSHCCAKLIFLERMSYILGWL
jgi:hypothetical protein